MKELYINKKIVEIVNVGTELHYIYVSDDVWKKRIEERNKKIKESKDGSEFSLDEFYKFIKEVENK